MVSFRDIYLGFKSDAVRKDSLVKGVEARWKDCEQPLFVLGFALNPRFVREAASLPATSISSIDNLCKYAVYYYRRFVDEDVGCLKRDMFWWLTGEFTHETIEEFDGVTEEYWRYVAATNTSSKLPRLAVTILSIAVNTATCERLFSQLRAIHTAKRNRMTSIKSLKSQMVAQHVRERYKKQRVKKSLIGRIMNPDERAFIERCRGASARQRGPRGIFSPGLETPPQQTSRTPAPASQPSADDDDDDPGDCADGYVILEAWSEYLDDVYGDPDLLEGYEDCATDDTFADVAADVGLEAFRDDTSVRALRSEATEIRTPTESGAIIETEVIPVVSRPPFPDFNQRDFPQESTLTGIRAYKATLAELFDEA